MDNRILRKAKVLVVVKAYPNQSKKYEELVCTAGLLDGTQWIRIYPVPYRFLASDNQYPKYGWIELDLERRHDKDFRPESYRLLHGIQEEITLLSNIPATQFGWIERRKFLLNKVYTSMEALINDAYSPKHTSIGVLKPKEILDVSWEESPEEEELPKSNEADLFADEHEMNKHRPVKRVPYRFSYRFMTDNSKPHKLMVEDWEIGALYWNCFNKSKNEQETIQKVIQKMWSLSNDRDLYFVLGTTLKYHAMHAQNPFVIIGLFYPPRLDQPELFD